MNSLRFMLASILLLAASTLRADEPTAPQRRPEAEYRRPELVAMAWQQSTTPNADGSQFAVWRPDGSLIEGEEVDWLHKDLKTFNSHWWTTNSHLRPLVFVFRVDERAKSPQTLMGGVLVDGRFQPSGSGFHSTPNFLAKTAIVPSRSQLAAWPNEVDVEIRVPVGEPETVKSFDRLPDGDLKIADGVRWYVDRTRGIQRQSGTRKSGFPAAVLEIDEKLADPLSAISAVVRLKDGRALSEDHVTLIDVAGKMTVRVSRPLDESNPIVSGEFMRQRYRLERYEKLPTRLDLKPEDPKPAVPAVEAIRRL